jgi:hypothetical protein
MIYGEANLDLYFGAGDKEYYPLPGRFRWEPPAIGTLYVQKWLLGKEPPKQLTVTIGEAEE